MNDLEHEIRDALRRHEGDAPPFDASDARRATGRTRQRQILNVLGFGLGTIVIISGLVAGLNGLVGADRRPTVIDAPPPAPTSVATPTPGAAAIVHGWPGARSNPAGVYSWDVQGQRWMHNVSDGASGVVIEFWPIPIVSQGEETAVTVAGYEGIYRQIPIDSTGVSREEWIVDIEGTTVSLVLTASPGTTEAELAEAHAVIASIRSEPQKDDPGFMLTFTLSRGWDSG